VTTLEKQGELKWLAAVIKKIIRISVINKSRLALQLFSTGIFVTFGFMRPTPESESPRSVLGAGLDGTVPKSTSNCADQRCNSYKAQVVRFSITPLAGVRGQRLD
jgi:hypothetical protein